MLANMVQRLTAALDNWEKYGSGIFESYHDETLWEIVESDPQGLPALEKVFESMPESDGRKVYLGALILQRVPYIPAYLYLTQVRGIPAESYNHPLYEGVALLRKQGIIK